MHQIHWHQAQLTWRENGSENVRKIMIDVAYDTQESLLPNTRTGNDWQYVTLSHCWGESTHLSTEKETLNERKHAIPFNSLNKTYADAVRVTRELKMRYLWIDSLCIIQDSDEDWIQESSKMCFVYNNAEFNIAAAAALDGDSGFLLERLSVKLGHVIRTEKKTTERSLWIRPCIQTGHATGGEGISLPCPLFGRAWVLQESILAARTLIYSPVGMHFRCRMSQRSDEDPAKDAGDLDIFVGSKLATFPYLALLKGQQRFYSPQAIDIWYQLLEIYSGKQILHRKDKLPAVSGLAYQLGSIIGDTYLAGLWARDFPQALCWLPHRASCVCVRRSTLPADSIYDAPSWSWASCCTLFSYAPAAFKGTELLTQDLPLGDYSCPGSENTDILWDAMLVGAHIDFVSNRYGPVRSGSITVKGHLLKIDISCFVSPFRENVAIYNGLVLGTFYTDEKLDVKKKYWALLLGYERRKTTFKPWSSAKQQTLVLLKQMGDGMERRICLGLILMEFGCGSFKRVAYFEKFDAVWPPETRDVVIW
ncbi:hypothetical protein BOTCAL_0370g00050 [Botryotinia calthae]|uniref:Heterokaryon incompatibility domain-containing protein n=1 Tax=Botryotinia calthae TaxID=38488 RepID=A0A4Y8CRT2_9HELO|nr:hypothetical protein BOTCAL_0370g00050 [Botryotinia calthae]